MKSYIKKHLVAMRNKGKTPSTYSLGADILILLVSIPVALALFGAIKYLLV